MFVDFEICIYEAKDLPFWPLKIPYYETYYLNYDMIRLRLLRATIPLLNVI